MTCQYLFIDYVPSEPQNLVSTPLSPTSIQVTWDPPAQTKGPLLEYVLFYYVDGAVEEDEVCMTNVVIYPLLV